MIAARHCVTAALRTLLENQPLSTGKVSFVWSVTVGPRIDRVTSATLKPDGILAVQAENHHWAREVGRSSPLIISRLNRLLGTAVVRRIKVSSQAPRRRNNRE
ncbi:MAG: DciA family protein [Acidobacteriota bacterium]|nr:DciA family protein [Acidobacteriota bacterium]